jgi:hypothetical protein
LHAPARAKTIAPLDVLEEIRRLRKFGEVRCGYVEKPATLMDLAHAFSLNDDNSLYRTVAKTEAVAILTRLLHKDLAYNQPMMPLKQAAGLAELFLAPFNDSNVRFYTNIDFSEEGQKLGPDTWAGPKFSPVTDATFDAGVIAIAPQRAACLWIEDED